MSLFSAILLLAAAQSPEAGEEIIVVKAQRLVDQSAVSVEEISEERISASTDLKAALTSSPSVDIVTPGAAGATEILLRGGDANFTAVTLDGVRLNDVTDSRGGAVDVGAIAPFEIGQVRIAKGAVSVLEGSDALSGQIALETDDPRYAPLIEAMAHTAEDGLGSVNARLTPWRSENAGLSVTGTWFDLGDAPGGQSFTRQSLGAKLAGSASVTGSWSASARYGETSREAFPDASGGDQFAVLPDLEESDAKLTTASLRYGAGDTGGWSPSVAFTYLRRTEDRVSPAVPPQVPPGATESEFERLSAIGTLSRPVSEKWDALFGGEVVQEEGETTGYLDFGFPLPVDFKRDRTTPSVFAEARRTGAATATTGGVDLYAGVRADYIDTEEVVPTVRAGLVYHLAGGKTAIKASAGTGFKSPSFYAVGDPLVGNPDLEDERSVTGEVGISHQLSEQTSVEISGYYAQYTDLIDFDGATFSLVNRAEVDISGIEATATHQAGANTLSAFVAYTNVDAPEGAVLLRPDWRAGARWQWSADRLSAYASYTYRSETEASSAPTGFVTLQGSHRLDAMASYDVTDNVAVALTADDVFDSESEAQPGFTPFGRRIGVRLDLAY